MPAWMRVRGYKAFKTNYSHSGAGPIAFKLSRDFYDSVVTYCYSKPHKLEEFKIEACPLADLSAYPSFVMPPETGDSFLANSVINQMPFINSRGL